MIVFLLLIETYSKEELARKTEDVDEVIKRLEEKFKDEQELKSEVASEYDDDADSFIVGGEIDADMEDLQRDVNLPSNMDSKLWRLKVKPGMERQLVMRLTNKLINNFNNGQPLMVMQVFESENTSGVIFVEAYKLSHVEQLTRGMAGIYQRGLRMIPISEMTEVMKTCAQMKESPVVPHQWVRIAKGPFAEDLGLVEKVIGSREVLVRLIPRIPDAWLRSNSEGQGPAGIPQSFRGLNLLVRNLKHVKIPQRFFNPELVKNEAKLEFSQLLGKKVYLWKDMMFRNGFFYHRFSISKLIHENVCPMIDEVRRF